jgi:hypothetical protein
MYIDFVLELSTVEEYLVRSFHLQTNKGRVEMGIYKGKHSLHHQSSHQNSTLATTETPHLS